VGDPKEFFGETKAFGRVIFRGLKDEKSSKINIEKLQINFI
jgi:hypothetical protein